MLVLVMWVPKGPPHREINEHRARCSRRLHDVAHRTDHECRNATRLDAVRDETHGLVAKRSIWRQDGQVDTHGLQLIRESRCQLLLDLLLDFRPANKREK